jgi:hypothetical protein
LQVRTLYLQPKSTPFGRLTQVPVLAVESANYLFGHVKHPAQLEWEVGQAAINVHTIQEPRYSVSLSPCKQGGMHAGIGCIINGQRVSPAFQRFY